MEDRDKVRLARIEELERETAGYGDQLLLLREIIERRAKWKGGLELEPVSKEIVVSRLSRGEPAIGMDGLGPSLNMVLGFAKELEEIFKNRGLVDGEPLFEEYLRKAQEERLGPAGMIDGLTVLGPVYQAMMMEALKPAFERHREACEGLFEDSMWLQPYCYVCGGEPDLAYLAGEENRRYFYCGLCDASWLYLRFKCPFCGNEDQGKLLSLGLSSDHVHAVDACQVCKGYLKVVDTRATGMDPCLLEVEDLLMNHLDDAAQREGFRSP
jgi:FdhE protein